jgi:TonB family protein
VTAAQFARIEIVIGPDGLVDAVKLLPGTRPVSVTEAMLLSAAKAWRFSPATRDGNPVKYRETVFLSEK